MIRFRIRQSCASCIGAFIMLTMSSCAAGSRPILSERVMADVLVDAELAHALAKASSYDADRMASSMQHSVDVICQRHGVKPTAFYRSYLFYIKNPYKMQAVYSLVLQQLENEHAQLN